MAESDTDAIWQNMHMESGQVSMLHIRNTFRSMGFDLGRVQESGGGAFGRIAAEYARRHPGQQEMRDWVQFREACDRVGLGPVPVTGRHEAPVPMGPTERLHDLSVAVSQMGEVPGPMTVEARERMVYGARNALQWTRVMEGGQAHPPQYPGDVGVDLQTTQAMTVIPGEIVYLPLGVAFAPPANTWILLVGRSSLAAKLGLAMVPGVIDNGFRGQMLAGCYTIGTEPVFVAEGTRVAQAILIPSVVPMLREVQELPESERGQNGFGSTGGH